MTTLRLLTLGTLAAILAAATTSAHAQTYTVLYNFGSHSGDPTGPHLSFVAQGRDGNLYSAADDTWTDQIGTAFKITPAGLLTVLHHFSGPDGRAPVGGLTLGSDGNFYGTTVIGGLHSHGTIFKISASGVLTTLYNFTGGADGSNPAAPLIEGFDGNFYGTTAIGGSVGNNGTVYKITPSGAFTTLHSFGFTSGDDYHNAPLLQGTDGYLYGTTTWGGTHGLGTIFRISPSGNFTTLFNFDGTHGAYPTTPVIQASDGNFYGVATSGGANCAPSTQCGVVFKITPTGALGVLHNFTEGGDGGNEVGGLIQASDGNLYGTNDLGGSGSPPYGVLFRITLTGIFTVLHNFTWDTGDSSQATLLQHTNGVLYSTTAVGGINNNGQGTFYRFDLGLHPFARLVPEGADVGSTIGILGQGFTGTSNVSFNGIAAAFTVVSDTYLTATVPAAATTGFVAVTTPSGTLTSNKKFLVGLPIVPQSVALTLRSIPYPTPPVPGGLLTYAFKVWNNTSEVASHEVLSTQVPAGTTFSGLTISGTAGLGSCTHPAVGATGSVICHEGSGMAPGTTWTIRMTVHVTASAGTVITEAATASSDNLGSNTVTVRNTVH